VAAGEASAAAGHSAGINPQLTSFKIHYN